jgi:hypothetical protein
VAHPSNPVPRIEDQKPCAASRAEQEHPVLLQVLFSYYSYANHFRYSIDVIPAGVWNAAFNKEGFVLMNYHLFITKQYLCLTFGNDEY